ncbi:MAG TPA: efflux RND transporter periplasmic adaptor subunit [Geobacteraceae bacterium]|nr:efflux RND transporter periplasmic adaptor subunit [Geobacteraceae bacterium]
MKKVTYLLLFLGAVVAGSGCSGKRGEEAGGRSGAQAIVKGATVSEITPTSLAETVELVGTVRARTSAAVAARVAGSITLLRVREGDRVKKGELLARLDAQENQASAAFALAGIDDARRALDEAAARKKLADITSERYQRLFSEQAVTRQEFDLKQTEKELAAQSVARAEARLKQAQELSRGAGAVADYTRITAPLSGIVTAKHADLGSSVFPSQPIFTIEDEGSYLLELSLPESLLAKVKPGVKVQVTLDAIPGSFSLPVSEIVPAADPVSRTFTAKIPLNMNGLKSGMFGRAAIPVGTVGTAVMVAKSAVVERGSLTSVWVVGGEKIARMRLVRVGKSVGDKVEILSGLSAGERVVTVGTEKVSEGAKVE